MFDSLLVPSPSPISIKQKLTDDIKIHQMEDILDSILPPRSCKSPAKPFSLNLNNDIFFLSLLNNTVYKFHELRHFVINICDYLLREWAENNQLWVQHVSSTPATRLEVVSIQEELDRRLKQCQARETGICPVRRELYTQCFGTSVIHFSTIKQSLMLTNINLLCHNKNWYLFSIITLNMMHPNTMSP